MHAGFEEITLRLRRFLAPLVSVSCPRHVLPLHVLVQAAPYVMQCAVHG
jgi:hypothetical protein